MRILIEPSSSHCLNAGDVAMLQVAYQRLRARWPQATIAILTSAPEALASYCPGAEPLDVAGRTALWQTALVAPRLGGMLGPGAIAAERSWRSRHPGTARLAVAARARDAVSGADAFLAALGASDLVVASGAGQITDAFRDDALLVLDTLEAATARGIPAVMVGQGIGPIADPALLARCATVLPTLSLVTLREGETSRPLLSAAGVPDAKIRLTGDDAIEAAHQARADTLGTAIGINVRVADYASADGFLGPLRQGLQQAAARLGAGFVPVAISVHPQESDGATMQRLLEGVHGVRWASDAEVVAAALSQLRAARVMVTGSYHGAVFALSQGIPVIGLTNSAYYDAKFRGLRAQFGPSCQPFPLAQPDVPGRLAAAIAAAWADAPAGREPLLDAARRQIALSRAAYDEIVGLTARQ